MSAEHWQFIAQGVGMTLWLTLTSGLLSLAVGILLGVLRTAPLAPLRALAAGYTEFFRNIPLLTVLFFIYYGVPIALRKSGLPQLDGVTRAILALGLYTGAYVGEVIRAGLGTVSKGNLEAARSLGLSYVQMIRYVQLPQALRVAIPPLGTLLIALLKNTALAGTISVADLLFQAELVRDRTFIDTLLIAGALYVAMTLPLGAVVNAAERRWAIQR
ncbi:MAG TPA: amino acid ABC transporter permease [Chloroflexia bacterium]|nr:amino acid ABC transporter permease [Chloroflexia bacterium]